MKKETNAAQPAKLLVEVPADARLFIDGQQMKATAERRSFNTPALPPGQSYFYEVKAEVVRDGKTYSESKRVIVRAGETARAAFPELTTAGQAKETKPVASAR